MGNRAEAAGPPPTLAERLRRTLGLFGLVYLLAVTSAYLWRRHAHDRLDAAFRTDLVALTTLGDLRQALRGADHRAELFRETGDVALLPELGAELQKARGFRDAVDLLPRAEEEASRWPLFRQRLDEFLASEEEALRGGKGAPLPDVEPLMLDIVRLRTLNIEQLQAERRSVVRTSVAAFLALFLFGLLSTALLAASLGRSVVAPLESFVRRVEGTRFGGPEAEPERTGLAELDRLGDTFDRLVRRLGGEFEVERKRSEVRSRLLAMVVHEYGNAMTGLQGGLELLRGKGAEAVPRERVEELLESSATTLWRMTEHFVALARSSDDGSEKRCELDRVVRESAGYLALRLHGRGPELAVALSPGLPPVRGDAGLLSFVVSNLLGNAVKYSKGRGRVEAGARQAGDTVECWVADEGVGMSPAELQKALSGGFRADAEATQGLGMGLSLCRDVIEWHGGRLEGTSEPGRGTRFAFRLPVWREEGLGELLRGPA